MILFPKQPHENVVDYMFLDEYLAAQKAGFKCHLIIPERIKDTPMSVGIKAPKFEKETNGIYRGWIIRSNNNYYTGFYHGLLDVNRIKLVNNPFQYKTAQFLCESYSHFNNWMIPSVFLQHPTKKMIKLATKQLQSLNLFVKDYVKSEPQYNKIDVRDVDGGMDILNSLKEERDDMFEGGFVLRPYVDLMSVEYRLWVYRGRILNEFWEKLPEDFQLTIMH